MADDNDRIHVSATDARAGATPGVTRYVLIVSLTAAIAAMAYILLT